MVGYPGSIQVGRGDYQAADNGRHEVTQPPPQIIDMMGQQGVGEGMPNIGEMLSELLPKKKKRRTVTVADARRILLDEEFDKLIRSDHEKWGPVIKAAGIKGD